MNSASRDKMLRNNILLSGMLKFVGLATSFLIVPVTLHYLDNEPYGIWMTISSMAFWIFTFDIGLGNGLRNYLTATISKGDFRYRRSLCVLYFCYALCYSCYYWLAIYSFYYRTGLQSDTEYK